MVLSPTPPERMLDSRGRPYFLWDCAMTLQRFEELLRGSDPETHAYLVGKLMRQAKPDDVFTFVRLDEIAAAWPCIVRHLGRTRAFWTWWLADQWKVIPRP